MRGLALWPLWAIAAFLVNSKVTVGAWFVSSGFFVAENPALGHPWLAWMQVWDGLIRLAGPVLPWIAVASAVAIVVVFVFRLKAETTGTEKETAARGVILPLALAACAALPLYAYYKGHPVRIRYDVPLVAAAAALTGTAVALLPRRARGAVRPRHRGRRRLAGRRRSTPRRRSSSSRSARRRTRSAAAPSPRISSHTGTASRS